MPDLHLIRMHILVPQLFQFARARHLHSQERAAIRYMLHMLLKELFKEQGVGRFFVEKEYDGVIQVVAYGPSSACLHRQADEFADPQAYRCLDWQFFASKPMPAFPEGRRLRFQILVNPAASDRSQGRKRDIFHLRKNPDSSREEVYAEWLRGRLGSVELESFQTLNFWKEPVLFRGTGGRNTGGRTERVIDLPVADFGGTINVSSAEVPLLISLLDGGIGRGGAFGFGMLRVLPAI